MLSYFRELYAYHYWANARVIQTMRTATAVPPKAVALFSHLLNAYFVWIARIEGQPPAYAVWQEHAAADWENLNEQCHQSVISLLSAKEDIYLETIIHYQNTKGVAFSNTVGEILTHVANHTTHHRAQVALELRRNGIAPPATDYIYYKRKAD